MAEGERGRTGSEEVRRFLAAVRGRIETVDGPAATKILSTLEETFVLLDGSAYGLEMRTRAPRPDGCDPNLHSGRIGVLAEILHKGITEGVEDTLMEALDSDLTGPWLEEWLIGEYIASRVRSGFGARVDPDGDGWVLVSVSLYPGWFLGLQSATEEERERFVGSLLRA